MSSAKPGEPIDAVVTWVDGDDPRHQQKLETYLGWRARKRPKAAAKTRYADRGELEYCIASLLRFAPWLRYIFIVTDEQVPGFVGRLPAAAIDRIRVVDHKVIFRDMADSLPTFNSLSIETLLWRIPGLADNFVYFNDDCFLIKPVAPEVFFKSDKVVLRGTFRSLVKSTLKRKLKRMMGMGRPTRRTLQSETASLAGAEDRYLDVGHIPHPMRVSTFRDCFAKHPERMRRNASYPLRHVRQFWPVALANHLELRHDAAEISPLPEALYLSSTSDVEDIESLIEAETRPECKFLCAQSLDNASDAFMRLWIAWMDRIIGRLQPDSDRVDERPPVRDC
nr:stealth family protein [Marinobacter fonticola]